MINSQNRNKYFSHYDTMSVIINRQYHLFSITTTLAFNGIWNFLERQELKNINKHIWCNREIKENIQGRYLPYLLYILVKWESRRNQLWDNLFRMTLRTSWDISSMFLNNRMYCKKGDILIENTKCEGKTYFPYTFVRVLVNNLYIVHCYYKQMWIVQRTSNTTFR